ncbi:hypothetical protein NDU88_009510 [Pleurodeles waltl]|uniref:Uncharacterized protein n=1 Tax=Pleurodeles waltl TaxID=8319 RepID=A0AAV7PUX6_PLEWA|nr:hypothetical protein NDU88_009510 [Pleurodeles waltl]
MPTSGTGSREGEVGEGSRGISSPVPLGAGATRVAGAGEAKGDGGQGFTGELKGPRDQRVPISKKWPTMLQWSSSDEEGGPEPEEGEWSGEEYLVGRAHEGPRRAYGGPGKGEKGDRCKAGGDGYPLGEGGFLEQGVVEVFSPHGTPDLIGQDTLDFEEEDPGEQCAARSPWEEVKVGPGAAGRITSAGRRGGWREAAEVP